MIKEYINSLDRKTVIHIIRDYEQFERVGMIGDCELRRHAQKLVIDPSSSIVLIMERVAFEAYRRIAGEVMNDQQHTKLEQQDHERFFDAIDKSPEPTQALRDLFKADIDEHDAMMLEHYMNQYVYFKDLCFDVLEEKINREELAVALHGFDRGHDA